jgi:hypothetical protein
LVLLILLLLCLALCAVAVFLVGRASAQGTEPRPLDVLLLIDHSNSMWDKGGVGSDPDLLRVQAANLFIAYLGVDTARTGNRLGIIHFGGSSELVVPLTPLNSAGRRQAIRAAIANPHRLNWTDPLEALQLAYETLFPPGRRDPARQPVVILLTDGKPELSPSPKDRAAYVADLRALVGRFREQGCPIFTIALTSEATDADPDIQTVYRNLWQEIAAHTPPAEYHEARAAGDLLRIYHAVGARLSGAEPDAPVIETSVSGQTTSTITVEAGLAQVRLVVLRSDPVLEVRLLRPGGALARPDDPDVRHTGETGVTREEVWAITNPRPGHWTLELRGRGWVLVWQDAIPEAGTHPPVYAIEVTGLPTHIPAGQSLDVGVFVHETSTGERVAGPSLQIVAELRRAGFAEATLLADTGAGDDRYCITLPNPPPGACTLRLRGLLDGVEIARREIAFEVIPFEDVAHVPLEAAPLTAFISPLAAPISSLKAPVSGASPRRSGPGWLLPLVGLTGLAVLGGAGGLLIRQRRGRVALEGSLRALAAPSSLPSPPWGGTRGGIVLDLPAVPSVVLGGTDKGAVPLPGASSRAILRAGRTPEGETETWVAPLAGEDSGTIALNGHSLETARRLCDGDVLTLGDYRLRYESLRQASAQRARRRPFGSSQGKPRRKTN